MQVLKTTIPSSPILKKYIECFYFYSGESDSELRYLAFPHFNTCLSIFKGVAIKRQASQLKIVESNNNDICVEFIGKYTSPVLIQYEGKCEEISIIFKPFGVNRFWRDLMQPEEPYFSRPLYEKTWIAFLANFFQHDFNLNRLETFLLSQFRDTQEFAKLEESLMLLNGFHGNESVSSIALKCGYNPKTFHRNFKKQMGCTPIEYRRICKFRNSVSSKLSEKDIKSLTDLTYENGFFDQAHFIREFKKLTNHNPKDYFKMVNKADGDKIVWKIL